MQFDFWFEVGRILESNGLGLRLELGIMTFRKVTLMSLYHNT